MYQKGYDNLWWPGCWGASGDGAILSAIEEGKRSALTAVFVQVALLI